MEGASASGQVRADVEKKHRPGTRGAHRRPSREAVPGDRDRRSPVAVVPLSWLAAPKSATAGKDAGQQDSWITLT